MDGGERNGLERAGADRAASQTNSNRQSRYESRTPA